MADEGKKGQAPEPAQTGAKPNSAKPAGSPPLMTFEDLIETEFKYLNPPDPPENHPDASKAPKKSDESFARPGPADEPWVVFTPYDHFGLALSGGGIRSATFNLGLLQGLNRRGVLEHVDYLSTVSGGGYTGGFWTAWRYRRKANGKIVFPSQPNKKKPGNNPSDMREGPEIRHLREFSRFLMPRIGYTRAETWNAIVTILSGLLPSLLMTLALTSLMIYGWLGVNNCLLKDLPDSFGNWSGGFIWSRINSLLTEVGQHAGIIIFLMSTLIMHLLFERRLRDSGEAGDAVGTWRAYAVALSVTIPAVVPGWWFWHHHGPQPGANHVHGFQFFRPAVAWAGAGVILMCLRFLGSGFRAPKRAIKFMNLLDRCIYRCLAPAVLWALAAAAWELCRWLEKYLEEHSIGTPGLHGGGGFVITAVLGALFAWLRGWLVQPVAETNQSQLLGKLVAKLKPWIPQMLANASVVVFVLSVILLIQDKGLGYEHAVWIGCGSSAVVVLLLLWLFDPARVGLHNFYRERIARCYLGAARRTRDAAANRQTSEQQRDDLTLGELRKFLEAGIKTPKTPNRPIQLVCCAANDLYGDTLGTLYRGARSAVLSPHGISLGNHTKRLDSLGFSAALTASAAAFNSQMGRLSMELGPAVAIVMSALNLRLGLWVPHPLKFEQEPDAGAKAQTWRRRYIFPGRLFLCEMFGLTKCDALPEATAKKIKTRLEAMKAKIFKSILKEPGISLEALMRNVHLSDGGHFENLGLYELIRRHCRYVIVSDCGADPEVAFDDLATALRRVREDFGVEIDLNMEPLRPGPDKRSAQHAVVGTIHYDGLDGTDKGTILYFKPSLTGDEPPDTIQYQTRNPAFPHESTMNQFYDEAQWEAYRRLGEHQASLVLPFTPKRNHKNVSFVENLFLEASQRWHPAPARQSEIFLELTERCSDLEKDMRDAAPVALRLEFFPEVAAAGLAQPSKPDKKGGKEKQEIDAIYFLMIAIQIMEDTWLGAELDVYWSHPLNEGWMHYFQRWASMPTFRRWWPVLRPLYSSKFGDFVKDRFDLHLMDKSIRDKWPETAAQLKLDIEVAPGKAATGLAWQRWVERYAEPCHDGKNIFDYNLKLSSPPAAKPVQVGFLLFTEKSGIVEWRTSELFVPHSLIGGGIIARFLDAVIHHFVNNTGVVQIQVELDEEGGTPGDGEDAPLRPDMASRQQRVHTINFYKSRFFTYQPPAENEKIHKLVLTLARPGAQRMGLQS